MNPLAIEILQIFCYYSSMFIAHLPAGYILTKKLQKKLNNFHYLWIGLIASILPDLDMLWFYLVDDRQTLHHKYWTHIPAYWLGILIVFTIVLYLYKKKDYIFISVILFTNITLHLTLDAVTGKIDWLYPISNHSYVLIEVSPLYSWWVWNFVINWTFLLEIAIIIWSIAVYIRGRRQLLSNFH